MNWRALVAKLLPSLPYVAIVVLAGGWFAHYTAMQREIGALHAETRANDALITLQRDSTKYFRTHAARADHAVDSLTPLVAAARIRAQRSDSVSSVLTSSYRTLRDQALAAVAAPAGSYVPTPTMPQLIASADAAVNACELAKDDCKKRADLEQQRGDSARAAAHLHADEANSTATALKASQENAKRYKDALPSAAGDVVRAGWWTAVGSGVTYAVCHWLAHCR